MFNRATLPADNLNELYDKVNRLSEISTSSENKHKSLTSSPSTETEREIVTPKKNENSDVLGSKKARRIVKASISPFSKSIPDEEPSIVTAANLPEVSDKILTISKEAKTLANGN